MFVRQNLMSISSSKRGGNGQKNIVTNEENILENCCTDNKRIY